MNPRFTWLRRFAAATALLCAVTVGDAHAADRPPSQLSTLYLLNGEPQSGATANTSTGADATIAVTGGRPYVIHCTTDAYMLPGTTVSSTTGKPLVGGQDFFVLLKPSTTSLAFRAKSSAGTCHANELQ